VLGGGEDDDGAGEVLAGAAVLIPVVRLVGTDKVRDIRKCILGFLSKSILSNCLESLFYIDGLLSAGFKIRNLILRMTPLLGALGRHGSVVQVHLVTQHNEWEVIRIPGTGLDQELVPPTIKTFESVWSSDVISEYTTVCSAVESNPKGLEPLLASRVPDLHGHQAVIHHHLLGQEVSTNSSLVLVGELFVDILVHQGGLAHA